MTLLTLNLYFQRRKRPSRPQPPSAFAEEPAEPVEPPEPATKQPVELQSRVFPLEKLKKDVETSTETYKISREELKNVDIEEYINTLRGWSKIKKKFANFCQFSRKFDRD